MNPTHTHSVTHAANVALSRCFSPAAVSSAGRTERGRGRARATSHPRAINCSPHAPATPHGTLRRGTATAFSRGGKAAAANGSGEGRVGRGGGGGIVEKYMQEREAEMAAAQSQQLLLERYRAFLPDTPSHGEISQKSAGSPRYPVKSP